MSGSQFIHGDTAGSGHHHQTGGISSNPTVTPHPRDEPIELLDLTAVEGRVIAVFEVGVVGDIHDWF